MEYAVPSTKLTKRAQKSGHEPVIHPTIKLWKERKEGISNLAYPSSQDVMLKFFNHGK